MPIIPPKPDYKTCYQCGSVVLPDWQKYIYSGHVGWVGFSVCDECRNIQTHLSGSPFFVLSIQKHFEKGGFI